jgi:hypothetical protein
MSNTLVSSLITGAVAGAVAATVTVLVLGSDPAAPATPTAASLQPSAVRPVEPGNAEALAAVRTELAMLGERVKGLETRPAPARQVVEAPSEVAQAALDAEAVVQMRELVAALDDPNAAVPAGLTESMRQVYDNIRAEEREERDRERAEFQERQMNERMERYTAALGLDKYQASEMRVILTGEQTRRDEMFASARETGEWMTVRDTMRTLRDETQAALGNLLSPTQLAQYDEMDGGGRGFGGFGGGDRGGPGGDRDGRQRRE